MLAPFLSPILTIYHHMYVLAWILMEMNRLFRFAPEIPCRVGSVEVIDLGDIAVPFSNSCFVSSVSGQKELLILPKDFETEAGRMVTFI